MPKDRHDVIPGFLPVAPTIWEQLPVTASTSEKLQASLAPHLVLLFSWTGANGRHILKYTNTYQSLFPSTPILVITTSIKDLCFRSSSKKQSRLQPAVDRILSYGNVDNILIHAFSEGGSNKAVEFAEAYHKTTGIRLPCSALCLDSTPGHPRYLRLCSALKKSLPPHPFLRCSGLAIGGVLLGGTWILYRLFKGKDNNVISKTRRRLMDDTMWDLSAPRCYLYSPADGLIASRDVQEHVRESVEVGLPVLDVCFDSSSHCKHATEDATKYWGAISLTWRRTLARHATLLEKPLPYEEEKATIISPARSISSNCASKRTLCGSFTEELKGFGQSGNPTLLNVVCLDV